MENKKSKSLYLLGIVVILVTVIGLTYAFFAPQAGGTTSSNATVTSNTTDLLTFSINRDISFTVTQADFQENGENQSGDATATATLTPNNKTGAATMNYYLYLNIESNPTVYSEANTNEDPELMLQVFDDNNQLVTLTGLGNQKTIKGVTGYDITGVNGLRTLLDNHAISASNNTATIENWRIVITLINLDVNQNDNTGKEVNAEIIIQKNELILPYTGVLYTKSVSPAKIGESILPVYANQWCDVEIESGYRYDCFDTLEECNDALEDWELTETDRCDIFEYVVSGLSNYTTSLSQIKHSAYSVYCETDPYGYCSKNYSTFDECEMYKGNNKDCREAPIFIPIYIKHEVDDNMIDTSNVCIHNNNRELCFNNDEWVENDNDGSLTTQFLETKLSNFILYPVCYNRGDYIECSIEVGSGYIEVTVYQNGKVTVNIESSIYGCELSQDGTSNCVLPNNTLDLSNRYLIIKDYVGRGYNITNIEDAISGTSPELIPVSYNNNIEGYLANRYYEEFLLWNINDGYDVCYYGNNSLLCANELLANTPGAANIEQTLTILKSRIESIMGFEIKYYSHDTLSDILIPVEQFSGNSALGLQFRIVYEDNEITEITFYPMTITINQSSEWEYGRSSSWCGFEDGNYYCYCD